MGSWTAKFMCTSQYCPCVSGANWDFYNETNLNSWGRTKLPVSTTYVPLYKNLSGGYDKFFDCYTDLRKQANSTSIANMTNNT